MPSEITALRQEWANLTRDIESLAPESLPSQSELWSNYDPLPVAVPFHESGARYLTALAGVQSGKSYAAVREFIKRIYQDRAVKTGPLQYWAVAPIYPLTRRMESLLRRYLQPLGLIVRELKSERIIFLRGDILIQFKSADHPDYLVAEPVDGIWIDEFARMKRTAWTDNLEGRTTSTRGWHILTSASKGRNWAYKTFIKPAEDKVPEYAWFNWGTADNVAVPGIVEEVARKKATTPAPIFNREYMASLDAFEGQIYEEWSESTHVFSGDPPPLADIRYGFDVGYRHLGVLLAGIEDGDGRLWIVGEVAQTSRTLDWWADKAREMQDRWGEGKILYDPSRPDCEDAFQRVGIHSQAADNAVAQGIESVMRALHPRPCEPPPGWPKGKPYLAPGTMVHERCEQVRQEMPAYQWDDREKPVKKDDDALDALRYLIHNPWVGVRGM